MRIKISLKNKRIAVLLCLLMVAQIFALVVFPRTLAFWGESSSADLSSSNIITIGNWQTAGAPANFDDAIAILTERDPFLSQGINSIHILGRSGVDPYPSAPVSISQFDVLLFASGNNIIAAQVVGNISSTIFDSWQNLLSALNTNTVALNSSGTSTISGAFNASNVHTRKGAPITHNGHRWLARHDNVTSVPAISADWFLVSDTWVSQSYPIGSIVQHAGRHFRKISAADAVPGSSGSDSIWEEIVYLDRERFEVPIWQQGDVWNEGDVVYSPFAGQFFVSRINANSGMPIAGSAWTAVTRFDSTNLVQQFVAGTTYAQYSFVRRDVAGGAGNAGGSREHFIRVASGAGAEGVDATWAWDRVNNWDALTSVAPWSATVWYNLPIHAGMLVEYGGRIFQRRGVPGVSVSDNAATGTPPHLQPTAWQRILTWDETQRPVTWIAGHWDTNVLFYRYVAGERVYFVSVLDISGPWLDPVDPRDSPWFRGITEWNASQVYTTMANFGWGSGLAHAYTLDERTNERIFWQLVATPAGSTSISGAANYPSDDSPYWQRHSFAVADNLVITIVAGRPVVWDRVTTSANPQPPSVLNNDWQRRLTPISNRFVYTELGGAVTLWENIYGASNTYMPGDVRGWVRRDFATGLNFVYTVNLAGVHYFWYSPYQSSLSPTVDSDRWVLLNAGIFEDIPEFFWMRDNDGNIVYFEATPYRPWRVIQNAWVGGAEIAGITGGNTMINFWNENNTYTPGSIVVYGITATNTYRYFILRAGVTASEVMGIPPHSPAGSMFWQPIR
ncbi:MAG: hypothetical protein FWB72_07205 [Firmicutes bacterium]|nr:hypothetical protein [Bacillota bacterium]